MIERASTGSSRTCVGRYQLSVPGIGSSYRHAGYDRGCIVFAKVFLTDGRLLS